MTLSCWEGETVGGKERERARESEVRYKDENVGSLCRRRFCGVRRSAAE